MAEQVTLEDTLTEAHGRCCQVHYWWGIGAWAELALFPPLVAYYLPGAQVECQGRELRSTRVEIDTMQVMAQDAVGDFSSREGMELFPVHGYKYIEGFTQEVSTAHAGIEHGKAREIECRRDIQFVWFDI